MLCITNLGVSLSTQPPDRLVSLCLSFLISHHPSRVLGLSLVDHSKGTSFLSCPSLPFPMSSTSVCLAFKIPVLCVGRSVMCGQDRKACPMPSTGPCSLVTIAQLCPSNGSCSTQRKWMEDEETRFRGERGKHTSESRIP